MKRHCLFAGHPNGNDKDEFGHRHVLHLNESQYFLLIELNSRVKFKTQGELDFDGPRFVYASSKLFPHPFSNERKST